MATCVLAGELPIIMARVAKKEVVLRMVVVIVDYECGLVFAAAPCHGCECHGRSPSPNRHAIVGYAVMREKRPSTMKDGVSSS